MSSERQKRANMAREVKGSIVVRVTDMDVSATVGFNHIKFTIL